MAYRITDNNRRCAEIIARSASNAAAAAELGWTVESVRVEAVRLRRKGFVIPNKPDGRPRSKRALEAQGDAWAAEGEPECAGVFYAAAERV